MKSIKVDNISLTINGKTILKNISFYLDNGDHLAIIGRNGSGKSMLLKILSTTLFPSSGTISILDKKFGETNLLELRKSIGIVSDKLQKSYYENSIVQNVVLSGYFASNGLYDEVSDDEIKQSLYILDFLNISHLKDRYYGELSNGEQKRVLIARALVNNPKLLILDEVCSGLDIASREDFLEFLQDLTNKNICNIIYVTHYIEEIFPAINKLLFLKEGTIYKIGSKKDILTNENISNTLSYNCKLIEKNGRYYIFEQCKMQNVKCRM